MNTRSVAIVAIVTLLTACTGLLIGEALQEESLGLALGLFVGIPVGLFLVAHRRRWIAVALLNAEFVLSYAVGGILGLLFSVTAAGLTFFVSASILRELYDGSEIEAFRHHLRLALGMVKGFQIIDSSKASAAEDAKVVLGPCRYIIKPGTAVMMEAGSRLSRISGPAMFTSKPYEYVKRIHDLGEKQQTFTFDGVVTRDLMSATVTVTAMYGLDIADSARQGTIALTPIEEAILRDLLQRTPDWEAAAKTALEHSVRQVIGSFRLSEVLRGTCYPRLGHEIWGTGNRVTGQLGVHIRCVTLESVRAKQEVMTALDNRWAETARAEGMREALALLADGYERARKAGMADEQITREVLRRTLEEMSRDPATKFVISPDLLDMLGRGTAQGPGHAHIGAGSVPDNHTT